MYSSANRKAAALRQLLPHLIADNFKAYDLPPLGERLGLEPGTDAEAMSSKRTYVSKRLQKVDNSRVRRIAAELADEIDSPELKKILGDYSPSDEAISATISRFDNDVVYTRWSAALERRQSDPEGAITLARTLLEDVMKWILTARGVEFGDTLDLPQLYRLVAGNLKLAPDEYTEDAFKRILGSCQSVVEGLGTLRNRLGDAHSAGPLRAKPSERHAEYAVNLSGATAVFLIRTFEARMA